MYTTAIDRLRDLQSTLTEMECVRLFGENIGRHIWGKFYINNCQLPLQDLSGDVINKLDQLMCNQDKITTYRVLHPSLSERCKVYVSYKQGRLHNVNIEGEISNKWPCLAVIAIRPTEEEFLGAASNADNAHTLSKEVDYEHG
jgi:hypothetical protein